MKDTKQYHWYRMIGHTTDPTLAGANSQFVYFVEAASPHTVLKYYGGKRKWQDGEGGTHIIQFPTREKDVMAMPKSGIPTEFPMAEATESISRIIPATRYHCACGKVHISEYPFKSMWCTCGKKAFPASLADTASQDDKHEQPLEINPASLVEQIVRQDIGPQY